MQDRLVNKLIALLRARSWRLELGQPECLLDARTAGDRSHSEFVSEVRSAESPSGQTWFLGSADYCDSSGTGWNFIEESLSIPAAEGDSRWISEIRDFWSTVIPIAIQARDEYTYLAIDENGKIVSGRAPAFEEVIVVASSFEKLVEILANDDSSVAQEWLVNS